MSGHACVGASSAANMQQANAANYWPQSSRAPHTHIPHPPFLGSPHSLDARRCVRGAKPALVRCLPAPHSLRSQHPPVRGTALRWCVLPLLPHTLWQKHHTSHQSTSTSTPTGSRHSTPLVHPPTFATHSVETSSFPPPHQHAHTHRFEAQHSVGHGAHWVELRRLRVKDGVLERLWADGVAGVVRGGVGALEALLAVWARGPDTATDCVAGGGGGRKGGGDRTAFSRVGEGEGEQRVANLAW
eukprot:364509-Chlamydomonas_euryale.AAC.8